MKSVILNIVFALGILLALSPLYGLGTIVMEMINTFTIVNESPTNTEPDISGPIQRALIAALITLPGYLLAVFLLGPLLYLSAVRQARLIRNVLIVTSIIVLLIVPVGTVVGILTLIALYLARAKFRA